MKVDKSTEEELRVKRLRERYEELIAKPVCFTNLHEDLMEHWSLVLAMNILVVPSKFSDKPLEKWVGEDFSKILDSYGGLVGLCLGHVIKRLEETQEHHFLMKVMEHLKEN